MKLPRSTGTRNTSGHKAEPAAGIHRSFNLVIPKAASLPDRVAGMLREAILRGEWKAGDQIVESRVAKQLGIGQNAMREALLELEFQGLVTKIPNRGNFVTKMSQEDVQDIYRTRVELESLAVRMLKDLGKPGREDGQRLSASLDRMEKGARKGDFVDFSAGDLDFHRRLWDLAGSKSLRKAIEVVSVPQFSFVLIQSVRSSRLDLMRVVQDHREWLDVLEHRSTEECVQHTRRITELFCKQILDAWVDE